MNEIKPRRNVVRELTKIPGTVTATSDVSPIALSAADAGAAIIEVAGTAAPAVDTPEAATAEAATAEAATPEAATAEPAATTNPEPLVDPKPLAAPAAAAEAARNASDRISAFGNNAMTAVAESQAAMARGFEAFAAAVNGFARANFAAAAESATALLAAKTLADAIQVQAGFARRSVDAAIDGSAKLSEISVRLTTEAARPWLKRSADAWKTDRLG